jgi:hypothetical protein
MSIFSKRSFKWLLILLVSFFFLIGIKNAYAPPPPPAIPTYTWSAHGNTSYGVYRSSIAAVGYSKGNCAHCHEQHGSIGGAEPEPVTGTQEYMIFRNLFGSNQGQGYCYWCHTDPTGDTNQQQISMPNQYNYSRMGGGDNTISCPDDINEAFKHLNADCTNSRNNWCSSSEGSAHCLENIQDYIKNTPAWNFGAEATVNPCSGCHNPHRAQRDRHDSSRWTGQKLPGVVSRPSHHSKDNNAWQLWGDDPGERMSDYTSSYQAPCSYPHDPVASPGACESGYEPDGSTTTNGSNLFDTVTFCLDCHQNSIASTRHGTVGPIDWSIAGDAHGKNVENRGVSSYLKFPYVSGDYVLSCLDCHEPHGSRNEWLLRQTVNGTQVPDLTPGGRWCYLCTSCHTRFAHWNNCTSATSCNTSLSCHGHGNIF